MENENQEEQVQHPPAKRLKKNQIEDQDDGEVESIQEKFGTSYSASCSINLKEFFDGEKSKRGANKPFPVPIHCDVNIDDSLVCCALSNDNLTPFNPNRIADSKADFNSIKFSHVGVSGIRFSKGSPHIFYSSSEKEASIFQWDSRSDVRKPTLKFQLGKELRGASKSAGLIQSILAFDVDFNDRLICGGTEFVEEDCYILFWDARSCKLLGTYSDSHSNDISAVRFAPNSNTRVVTGSFDGLVNLFDITATSEDDALLFSFNTESSVDCLEWGAASAPDSSGKSSTVPVVYCTTHTNDLIIYDTESGDLLARFDRASISKVIGRKNPDAVVITGIYRCEDEKSPQILCNSLAGNCTRSFKCKKNKLKPTEWLNEVESYNVIQCAQRFNKANQWVTFYDDGVCKTWKPS